MISRTSSRILSVLGVGLVLALSAGDADAARRGGSFGSRGMRTYNAPRPTQTAPNQARPIERSMTPQGQAGSQFGQAARPGAAALNPAAQAQRGGFLRRWGGPILGGIAAAGLLGMLMGHGFGGAAGMMAMLVQIAVVAGIAMLVLAFLRRRKGGPAFAGGPQQGAPVSQFGDYRNGRYEPPRPEFMGMNLGGMGAAPGAPPRGQPLREGDEIGVTDADFDIFERLLTEIQTDFGRADWDALRLNTTPEAMSYLSQELAQNAAEGRKNSITDVRLLQGDLAEAWREDDADYATVAMRFSSIDVTRDASGAVVAGDPDRPTETIELWTFRKAAGPWGERWKLSAIQDV